MSAIKKRSSTLITSPVSNNLFKCFAFIASVIMFIWAVLCCRWDTDLPWMIAQGREILNNGIPYTDTFYILSDMSIVVQGWLFYVILALFDNLGAIGLILFQILNISISIFAGYLYLSQYNIKFEYKILAVCALIVIIRYPAFPRPEGITVSLLIFECIAFEEFKRTHKWKWLIILPVGMLLEANLHCSMVWMHFLIALAYIVPSIIRKAYLTYNKSLKLPLFFTVLMIPCMFINPYGINGVLYLPNSILSGTFQYISIAEMQPEILYIIFFAIAVIGLYIPIYYKKHRRLYSYQVYLVLGFYIFSLFALRNVVFMYLAMLVILAPFLRHLTFSKATPRRYIILLFIAVCIYFGIYAGLEIPEVIQDITDTPAEMMMRELEKDESIIKADIYIKNHSDIETTKLFVGFNTGGIYEYLGYKNVYMDARPELRMKAINNQRDELIEYNHYCVQGIKDNEDIDTFNSDIKSWIDDYDFDYIYIEKACEVALYDYMTTVDSDYSLIFETEEGAFYEQK